MKSRPSLSPPKSQRPSLASPAIEACISACLALLLCSCGAEPTQQPADSTEGTQPELVFSAPAWFNLKPFYQYATQHGWDDTDLPVSSDSDVQLRNDAKLVHSSVEKWGWQPEFVDQKTGETFRFLHLRPQFMFATSIGTVYKAGTIVGKSGGDTCDTGYCSPKGICYTYGTPAMPAIKGVCAKFPDPYSTGAHLCVQTQMAYRKVFPADPTPWSCASSAYGGRQYWSCSTADANLYKCDASNTVMSAPCSRGCVSSGAGKDDFCVSPSPVAWDCNKSLSGGQQYWTCSSGKLYRCDAKGPIVVDCPSGCNSAGIGKNDTCR